MIVEIDDVPSQSLQASGTLREKPSSRKNICKTKCVLAINFQKTKFMINTDLKLTVALKMAKNRLNSGADLYYHRVHA